MVHVNECYTFKDGSLNIRVKIVMTLGIYSISIIWPRIFTRALHSYKFLNAYYNQTDKLFLRGTILPIC